MPHCCLTAVVVLANTATPSRLLGPGLLAQVTLIRQCCCLAVPRRAAGLQDSLPCLVQCVPVNTLYFSSRSLPLWQHECVCNQKTGPRPTFASSQGVARGKAFTLSPSEPQFLCCTSRMVSASLQGSCAEGVRCPLVPLCSAVRLPGSAICSLPAGPRLPQGDTPARSAFRVRGLEPALA